MRVRGRVSGRGRSVRSYRWLALLGVLALAVLVVGGSTPSAEANAGTVILKVPYLSQFDGSPYAGSNCGPTSLAMVLRAYGRSATIGGIRARVNRVQGTDAYDSGTSLETIAAIAREAGLTPVGLRNGNQHARWSRNALLTQLRAGNPIIPEVRYRQLPGHFDAAYDGDHYVVLVGADGDDVIYNDPAFYNGEGNARRTSLDRILTAMADSAFPYAAVAIAPGPDGASLLGQPAKTPAHPVSAPTPQTSGVNRSPIVTSPARSVSAASNTVGQVASPVAMATALIAQPLSDFAWKIPKEIGGDGNTPASATTTNQFSHEPSIQRVSGDVGQLRTPGSVPSPGALPFVKPTGKTTSEITRAALSGRPAVRADQRLSPMPRVGRNAALASSVPAAVGLIGLLAIGYFVLTSCQSNGSLVFLSTTDRTVLGRVRLSGWPRPRRWDQQSCARYLPEVGLRLLVARPGPTIAGRTTVRVTLVGPDGHTVIRIFHDLDAAFLSDSADREVIYQAAARSSSKLTSPSIRLVRSTGQG